MKVISLFFIDFNDYLVLIKEVIIAFFFEKNLIQNLKMKNLLTKIYINISVYYINLFFDDKLIKISFFHKL